MKKLLIVLGVVLVCVVTWILLSPLFTNTEVNEVLVLPGLEDMVLDQGMLDEMDPERKHELEMQVLAAMADISDMVVSDEMDEELMVTSLAPTPLLTGSFVDGDSFHQASGTATLFPGRKVAPGVSGDRLLRFEGLDVTNGPDLRVLLSPNKNPGTDGLGEYVEIARLKGNRGDQNYTISADLDPSSYKSVVIYCKPFRVIFGWASLG